MHFFHLVRTQHRLSCRCCQDEEEEEEEDEEEELLEEYEKAKKPRNQFIYEEAGTVHEENSPDKFILPLFPTYIRGNGRGGGRG